MMRWRGVLAFGLVSAALACSSSADDNAASVAANGSGGSTTGSGSGAATSSSVGGSGGLAAGGGGASLPGDDNPDGLPEVSTPLYARDYESQDPSDITSTPNVATAAWDASFGFGPSGGWRMQPDPIVDPNEGSNEAAAGWAWGLQGGSEFPVDGHQLVSVSYMFRVSQALLAEIALAGTFWSHDQKAIDFKYHNPSALYGEGNRNTIHFGEEGGQVRFSHVDGGGGARIYFGPDWLGLADEWVWVCHVIDMRAASADGRYIATYMKRAGDSGVTRIGIRYESDDPPLQAYDGHGVWGFLSPFHGYWDDMVDRNGLTNDLTQMNLSLDRVRVMAGWPDQANGPPF